MASPITVATTDTLVGLYRPEDAQAQVRDYPMLISDWH